MIKNIINSFFCWYKQISIYLCFSKNQSHLTSNYKWLLSQIFLFLPTIIIGVFITLLGFVRSSQINSNDINKEFKYSLTLVAIVKNEGKYLQEWIVYHNTLGCDRFVIYDNDSNDKTKNILLPFIKIGLVEYIKRPGKSQQNLAYTDALRRYKFKTKYLGFIDADEFIFTYKIKLIDFISMILTKYAYAGGVCIPWFNYGTSGHVTPPLGLVINNYKTRAKFGFIPNIKTIGNPRLMKCVANPHIPIWKFGTCNIDEWGKRNRKTYYTNKKEPYYIRINHYYTKSEEEYWNKISRGFADGDGMRPKTREVFNYRNRNEIYDNLICKYSNEIHKKILMLNNEDI